MQCQDEQELVEGIIRNGFWFVDVPRTGSTSLKREMEITYGPLYGKKRTTALHDHATAAEVREYLGHEAWDRLFTFSLVRNPWDRVYSLYRYRLLISKNIPGQMSFRDYVKELESQKNGMVGAQEWRREYRMSAKEYLADENGGILVRFVGKFEDRAAFFAKINQSIPVPLLGDIHIMRTGEGGVDLDQVYDEETKSIIENLYADDIEAFEYSFCEAGKGNRFVPAISPEAMIPHLTRRLERAEEDLNLTRHELESHRQKCSSFEGTNLQLRSRCDGMESKLKEAQGIITQLRTWGKDVEQKLGEQRNRASQLKASLDHAEDGLAANRELMASLEQEKESAVRDLAARVDEAKRLQGQLDDAHKQLSQHAERLDELRRLRLISWAGKVAPWLIPKWLK